MGYPNWLVKFKKSSCLVVFILDMVFCKVMLFEPHGT